MCYLNNVIKSDIIVTRSCDIQITGVLAHKYTNLTAANIKYI